MYSESKRIFAVFYSVLVNFRHILYNFVYTDAFNMNISLINFVFCFCFDEMPFILRIYLSYCYYVFESFSNMTFFSIFSIF